MTMIFIALTPDQTLPRQMAELVNHGIISVIEHEGNIIYRGARNTFECINQGLTWRQYIDESVCVGMDAGTCSSLGGYTSHGGSRCSPTIDLESSACKLCTKDLVKLCKVAELGGCPRIGPVARMAEN